MKSFVRKSKSELFRVGIDRHPGVRKTVRWTQYYLWKTRIALVNRRSLSTSSLDPVPADPRSIKQYIGDLPWSRYGMRGRIASGDWDLHAVPFEPWDVHRSMHAHFHDGVEWSSTTLYRRVCSEIESGHVRWGCTTVAQFEARLASLDKLFHKIASEGYRTQAELPASNDALSWEADSPFKRYDEVTVCIDRDGHLLLRDGKHRLSIARILDLDRIPVAIGLRHLEWARFVRRVKKLLRDRGGVAGHAFVHPDLVAFNDPGPDARFALIRDELKATSGRIIEAGATFGYHCHRLERDGFSCQALIGDESIRAVSIRLRNAEHREFKIVDLESIHAGGDMPIEAVIAIDATGDRSLAGGMDAITLLQGLSGLTRPRIIFLELRPEEDRSGIIDQLLSSYVFAAHRVLGATPGGTLHLLT